jgi:aromatic-L-amino-acid/L-tryptophan decarboxylase
VADAIRGKNPYGPMTDDPLALDAETMRRLGYRAVDMLVDRLTDPSIPPLRRATPDEMAARLSGPPPEAPQDFDEILRTLDEDVLPFMSKGDHPGFFAYVPFSGTWPGALGDLIASATNVYAGSWMEAAGPSQLELEVIGWFKEWVGYPPEAAGILVSGGSAANLTAIACARESLVGSMSDDLVAYVSDQAHSSVARSARTLGFRQSQVRVIPSDEQLRIRVDLLESAMDADLRAGRRPLLVSASGGATNSGAVDPLSELADLCAERKVWFHVDAAYGGFAVLAERGRRQLAGIERADSITLDPHKWFYQPYECGCLLVRDGYQLRRSFLITPDYLREAVALDREVNFSDLGLQLTRMARAFKVWVSVQYFGLDAFRRAIDRTFDLADGARQRIEASDRFELAARPSLGILSFRRVFERDEDLLNARLVSALEESGLGLVSSTRLKGRYTIRMCVMSHTSGAEHIDRVLDFLEQADVPDVGSEAVRYERHPDVTLSGIRRRTTDRRARFALLESLPPEDAARVIAMGEPRRIATGKTVIEEWDTSQEFFLIRAGAVDVLVDGERIARLGPDEFFGEIAALDWGAGFSYPRIARVVAAEPLDVLVYPDGGLLKIFAEVPGVEHVVRSAVESRLAAR